VNPILFIDGDIRLAATLAGYLEGQGFAVHIENDLDSGVAEALSGNYAMVVLDDVPAELCGAVDQHGTAESYGAQALRRIRGKSELPVLMMSAASGGMDCVAAVELGADGWIAKPCTPRELSARIRAILRRARSAEPFDRPYRALLSGGLTLWPEQRRAEWRGEPLPLTSTEFSLLEALLRHAGRPVSKRDLSRYALGRVLTRNDRRVDVHLSSIRRKLYAHVGGRSLIRAVHGKGYRLLEE
jgi:two-component system, OmpR family, response regulator